MNSENSSTGTILLAFLGGSLLGAGIALLYAPQSGRRTRQKLRDLGEEAGDYASDLMERAEEGVEKARRQGEAWLLKGQELVEEKKHQMAAAMDGAKK
jgi:gas vesicle protein